MVDIIPAIREAMHAAGIVPTEDFLTDGHIHRFHVEGDNHGKQNGWIVVNLGAFPHAYFGSWKTGAKHTWQLKQPTTAAEKAEFKKAQKALREQYQEQRKLKYAQAAELARMLLNEASPAKEDHPYLVEKNIRPHGAMQVEGALLIPMHHSEWGISSLQAIYADGSKRFLQGGQVQGAYFILDCKDADSSTFHETTAPEKVVVCEGYATACTLRDIYPNPALVVCAFTANNLESVSEHMHAVCPGAEIIIAADNDTGTEGNPGLVAGRKAALAVDAKLMYPVFEGMETTGTDFNDYINAGGQL